MKSDLFHELVLNLLEPGIYKTTAQVVEEFRMEYPEQWSRLKKEGEKIYGPSCSSHQQPATLIAQALLALPADSRLLKQNGRIYYWSRDK